MTAKILHKHEDCMVDGKAYRDAMSEIASPVHLIATDGLAGLSGMTVTALASVSDAPPTLLVCVNRHSPSAQRFIDNGVFSVNSLGVADRLLADIFAGRTDEHFAEKFTHGAWTPGKTGAPLLASAVASLRMPVGRGEGRGDALCVFRRGRGCLPSHRGRQPALPPPRLRPEPGQPEGLTR